MATSAYSVEPIAITNEARRQSRLRHPGSPDGSYMFKVSKSFVAASYDVAGDFIQICKFPDRFRLLGASIVSDSEYDTGGTAARLDLVLDDGLGTSTTTAVGAAFANQTSNEAATIVTNAAGDTTQKVTIVGTTTGTDTVVVEEVTLQGTTPVDTVKTDWGLILAAWVSSGTLTAASTVTIKEKSGGAAITTLTPSITSRGVNTVTNTSYYNRKISFVASGATTKQIGFKGTDEDGNTIYDSQAATGATEEQSNSSFVTVTEVYTGNLESSRTITIRPSEQLLVAASQAFNQTPILPINFNGASISGSGYGMDVSEQILGLRVAVAPTTANSNTITLTALIHGYVSHNPLVTLS